MSNRSSTSHPARVWRGISVLAAATLPAISGAALAHVAMPETVVPITSPSDARTRGVASLLNTIDAAAEDAIRLVDPSGTKEPNYVQSANGFAFVAMIGNGDDVLQARGIASTATRKANEMISSMKSFLGRFRKLFIPIPFYPWF